MQLVIGRIGRAHGVRGDLFVEPMTDEPDVRFADGAKLQTSNNQTLTVANTKWHSGRFIVHFTGFDDRNKAEELKGLSLSVDVDPMELPEDPDEFYDHQLVGLDVIHDDKVIGKVSEVIHLPAQDVLAITKTDGTESLVPFVIQFVPEVDIRGGKLTITPPPGLIDESEAIVIRDTEDEN
ncbi:MAG: hypothetical protein RIR66_664 [Actinomycetota bacterium]|jgi:16S rRNA processing protein RimM